MPGSLRNNGHNYLVRKKKPPCCAPHFFGVPIMGAGCPAWVHSGTKCCSTSRLHLQLRCYSEDEEPMGGNKSKAAWRNPDRCRPFRYEQNYTRTSQVSSRWDHHSRTRGAESNMHFFEQRAWIGLKVDQTFHLLEETLQCARCSAKIPLHAQG